jgi:hypothetical protein
MEKLARVNRRALVDLLAERLGAARTALALLDAAVERAPASELDFVRHGVVELERCGREASEHVAWLASEIERLGVDPLAPSESSRLAEVEMAPIARFEDGARPPLERVLESLMVVASIDHAGWSVLLDAAVGAADARAEAELRRRMLERGEHVAVARRLATRLASRVMFPDRDPRRQAM